MRNKVTITIKRPEGHIEVVDVSDKFLDMNDTIFNAIKTNTKAAGRGECLKFDVIRPELTAEQLKEIKEYDDKCRWFKKHGFSAADVR